MVAQAAGDKGMQDNFALRAETTVELAESTSRRMTAKHEPIG